MYTVQGLNLEFHSIIHQECAYLVRHKWTSIAVDVGHILDILKWKTIVSKSILYIVIIYLKFISELKGAAQIIIHKKIDVV